MRNYLANSPNKPKTIFSHSYGAAVEAIMEKAIGRQGGCAEQVHCESVLKKADIWLGVESGP